MASSSSVPSVQQLLKRCFGDAIRTAFPKAPELTVKIMASNPRFGDYQCNNAMDLYSQYKGDLSVLGEGVTTAKQVAEKIEKEMKIYLGANASSTGSAGSAALELESLTVAPAGFITIKLSKQWINNMGINMLKRSTIDYKSEKPQRVIVDFSSPNIAKEMHVGHLRSTIIGESLCRILEYVGHDVERLNHVGDWGTQFGMLIEYMKQTYPDFLTNMPNITDLQEFYKSSKKVFDEDPEFKKRAQLAVVDLQAGGEFATQAWKVICDVSRKSFESIYKKLDITVKERGESFYNPMIGPLITELEQRNIVKCSQGAMVIPVPSVGEVPVMVRKSDGGYCYGSTDMACAYHRLIVSRADWVIYVTDAGQEQHFFSIFDAARQAGWHRPGTTRLDHMGFGVVQGEDGKKFKTRSGDTVKLQDLLAEGADRAKTELIKRRDEAKKIAAEKKEPAPEEYDIDSAAEKIGYAAIKYMDLKNNRTSNYAFSFDKMLNPQGDTAVYLLYAYARICSIEKKSKVDLSTLDATSDLSINEPAERDLLLELLKFPDILESILKDLHIHYLCEYVFRVVGLYTSFHQKCKVVGTPEERSRLLLIRLTKNMLNVCFKLLGINPLERI